MNELTKGILNESSKHLIEGIAEKLKARGAEAISLSCTELPLLIKESVAGLKTYDTAKLHAKRAVRIALGLDNFPPPPQ
jgi:aspartate racemase